MSPIGRLIRLAPAEGLSLPHGQLFSSDSLLSLFLHLFIPSLFILYSLIVQPMLSLFLHLFMPSLCTFNSIPIKPFFPLFLCLFIPSLFIPYSLIVQALLSLFLPRTRPIGGFLAR